MPSRFGRAPRTSGTRRVYLYVEQGLGDAIQFYRFVAPLLERGAHVILSVNGALLRLLEKRSPKWSWWTTKPFPPHSITTSR